MKTWIITACLIEALMLTAFFADFYKIERTTVERVMANGVQTPFVIEEDYAHGKVVQTRLTRRSVEQ